MVILFRTKVVGDNSTLSANELKKCIDDQLVSGVLVAQSFAAGGTNLMVCH